MKTICCPLLGKDLSGYALNDVKQMLHNELKNDPQTPCKCVKYIYNSWRYQAIIMWTMCVNNDIYNIKGKEESSSKLMLFFLSAIFAITYIILYK